MIGHIIGNFRIVGTLGRGGMGEVFCAEQINVGTRVAIKLLGAELSQDSEYVQRFFNEARAVSKIRHPGVVQIFDVGRDDASGRAYLIMEFLDGESLRAALVRGRFPAVRIGEIGRQLASVLEATHAAGITHRDLKPDNIFLLHDPTGVRIKVLDFGIAKLTGALRAVSPQTAGTMGTPAYMAPEQWGDPTAIDHRADLYALGCVGFEMATGRPPFLVTTLAEACNKHLREPPPRAHALAPDVPEPLDGLLDRLLAKDPAARPTTRDALATFDALARGIAVDLQRTQDTIPPPIQHAPTQPAQRRSRAGWIVAAIVVVAGIATAIVVASSSSSTASSRQPTAEAKVQPADAAFVDWLRTDNPWMTDNEVPAQYHAVRRREYERYMATLGSEQAAWATPLFAPDVTAPDQPVTWVTWEQADRYCRAVGGKLPTSERWENMAAGSNGINPQGVRYWTATKRNGRAVVRGAFTEQLMDSAHQNAAPWLQELDTEASAGGRDPREKVASRQIGFRCTR